MIGDEMLDAVILNYNDSERTIACAQKLADYALIRRIIIVDNCSIDMSVEKISAAICSSDKIELIQSEANRGYGPGNNIGIRKLKSLYGSRYIMICNPDTGVSEETLSAILHFLKNHEEYAIAAPFMVNADGVKQYNTAFKIPGTLGYISSVSIVLSKLFYPMFYKDILKWKDNYVDVGGVTGSLFLFDTVLLDSYGNLFDEGLFLYREELCVAIKCRNLNRKVALLPNLHFFHIHSTSIDKSYNTAIKKHLVLLDSHKYVLGRYYSPSFIETILSKIIMAESVVERVLCQTVKKA